MNIVMLMVAFCKSWIPQRQLTNQTPTLEECEACTEYWKTHKSTWLLRPHVRLRNPVSLGYAIWDAGKELFPALYEVGIAVLMFVLTCIGAMLGSLVWLVMLCYELVFGWVIWPARHDTNILVANIPRLQAQRRTEKYTHETTLGDNHGTRNQR